MWAGFFSSIDMRFLWIDHTKHSLPRQPVRGRDITASALSAHDQQQNRRIECSTMRCWRSDKWSSSQQHMTLPKVSFWQEGQRSPVTNSGMVVVLLKHNLVWCGGHITAFAQVTLHQTIINNYFMSNQLSLISGGKKKKKKKPLHMCHSHNTVCWQHARE